jgi:hypothetical protein
MGDPSEAQGGGTRANRQTTADAAKTQHPDATKPTNAAKATWLQNDLAKHGYRWADPKESDFPLVIEMESPPVPEEIKGPFPEDAPWRTAEKPSEKKAGKSFWPW